MFKIIHDIIYVEVFWYETWRHNTNSWNSGCIFSGSVSIIFLIIANKRSKEANKISQEALQLSKDINKRNLENISIEGPGNPIVLKRSLKLIIRAMKMLIIMIII